MDRDETEGNYLILPCMRPAVDVDNDEVELCMIIVPVFEVDEDDKNSEGGEKR